MSNAAAVCTPSNKVRLIISGSRSKPNSTEDLRPSASPRPNTNESLPPVDRTPLEGDSTSRGSTSRGSIGLSTLEDVCELILQSHDLDQTLRNTVHLVAQRMGTEVCSVYLKEDSDLVLCASEGLSPDAVGTTRLSLGEGLIGYTAQLGKVINAPEPETHPRFRFVAGSNEERYHSFLGIPLFDRKQLIGVMAIQTVDPREFTRDDVSALTTIAFQLSTVIANARLLDAIDSVDAKLSGRETGSTAKAEVKQGKEESLSMLCGSGVTPGVAIAPSYVFVQSLGISDFVEEPVSADRDSELLHLEEALEKTRVETICLEKRVADRLTESDAAIFHAHLMILQDQSLLDKLHAAIQSGCSATGAVKGVIAEYVAAFRRLDDPYLMGRAVDVEDVGRRILVNLQGGEDAIQLSQPGIIVAKELMPSQIAMLPFDLVRGIVLESEQTNSHATIVARSMGIPTLVGVAGAVRQIATGSALILDAGSGRLYVDPSAEVTREYERLLHEHRREQEQLLHFKDRPAETEDGFEVRLRANVGLLSDIDLAQENGAEGVGLYRTEFPFMARTAFPTREEQYLLYRRAVENFNGQPVTFRTLDIGGDKRLPYFPAPEEENPTLGQRSIRVSLEHRDLFQTQVEAILMAARHGPSRIMFPMITTMHEMRECRQVIQDARNKLDSEGIETPSLPIGVMVEVPATIAIASHLAKYVDFFALGTNDLIQYMLGADRGNPLVHQYYDPLHPAILQAIDQMVRAAAQADRELCICGEMASDPACFALLVGLGLREFSVSAPAILSLKALLSRLSREQLALLAKKALEQECGEATRELVDHVLFE